MRWLYISLISEGVLDLTASRTSWAVANVLSPEVPKLESLAMASAALKSPCATAAREAGATCDLGIGHGVQAMGAEDLALSARQSRHRLLKPPPRGIAAMRV